MNAPLRHITPRLSPEELIRRAEARERRESWIAFFMFVGTVVGILVFLIWIFRRAL